MKKEVKNLECDELFVEKDTAYGGVKVFWKGKELNQLDNNGYRKVSVRRRQYSVHRLVAMAFLPNPNNYSEVNHLNGVKCDNRVKNLEWCTHLQNHQHADKIGLRKIRENHPSAKLDWKKVNQIRKLYPKKSQYELAYTYKVSRRTIRDIINGRIWKP